ncbi:YrhK family protein [Pseudovibrio sp. SPO723]|uniref:YrhK family protein n=1 Tax=Nesiotobacter zosterae TaxID=392721 RepID=UPI0029C36E79|nr:YrhK family protein [Pseudovibrio sp. SPO723]MDX5592655.1 YrhK family protein [Pseudovibrio sp. SPO723]
MKLFDARLRNMSEKHADLVRRYELWRTVIEFLAALLFVIGSVLFFFDRLVFAGTWLFLLGSLLFGVRPTIRLLLELHLTRLPVPQEFRPYGAEPETQS